MHNPFPSLSGSPVSCLTRMRPKGANFVKNGGTKPTAPTRLLTLARLQFPKMMIAVIVIFESKIFNTFYSQNHNKTPHITYLQYWHMIR